jgi:hypothetical protein
MQASTPVDDTVEKADAYELARNPIFVRLQHTLIARTAALEEMRCVYHTSLATVTSVHTLTFTTEGLHTSNWSGRWEPKSSTLSQTGSR